MKRFLKPEIELVMFDMQDVIITSDGGQINFGDPLNQIVPSPDSPANQTGWDMPTFNK